MAHCDATLDPVIMTHYDAILDPVVMTHYDAIPKGNIKSIMMSHQWKCWILAVLKIQKQIEIQNMKRTKLKRPPLREGPNSDWIIIQTTCKSAPTWRSLPPALVEEVILSFLCVCPSALSWLNRWTYWPKICHTHWGLSYLGQVLRSKM